MFFLTLFLAGFASAGAAPTTPIGPTRSELAVPSFAACLREAAPGFAWKALRNTYAFGTGDGFLTYLAVYPNRRVPGFDGLYQRKAHERWAVNFEDVEGEFVGWLLLQGDPITPSAALTRAIAACGTGDSLRRDAFCGTLVLHNVFRTLGRNRQAVLKHRLDPRTEDFNPHWFRQSPEFWRAALPDLQQKLIPLRVDGGGDRWGEWYHAFGILAFALHEAALRAADEPQVADLWLVRLALSLNTTLNPILAGGHEEPEKAQLDRDTLEVAREWFFDPRPATPSSCAKTEAFVNSRRNPLP